MNAELKIQDTNVVEILYTLTDTSGNLIDSSEGSGPLAYIQGKQNIIPGLEKELEGKVIGDKFNLEVPFAEAYGPRDERMIQSVPKAEFTDADKVQVGQQFQVQTQDGHPLIVVVSKIEEDSFVMDGNHPLAGIDLKFDVEVVSIRNATETELSHGHLHPEGESCGHGEEETVAAEPKKVDEDCCGSCDGE